MTSPSPLASPSPWNLVAEAYEADIVPQFERFAEQALRLAAPAPRSRIADVACGPGTLALLAARSGFTVDAIDFSPQMIERLERRRRSAGLESVRARIGDGQSLPFEDGAYSAAFSLFGLMFFPDRARGFVELRRILAPGGRAVVSSWQPVDRVPAMAAMFGALQDSMPRPPEGDAPPVRSPALSTVEDCRSEMGRSFEEVKVHPASISVQYASAAALWGSMARSAAPVVLMRRQMGEEWWAMASSAAQEAVKRAVGEGPVTLEMHAWLTVGVAG